ncbi:hypothetical protein ACYU03_08190 [Pseudomonas sp. X10]
MNKKKEATSMIKRTLYISAKLFMEQLKEPSTLLWTTLSPSAFFILVSGSRQTSGSSPIDDYIGSAAWFYAYISSSIALFGLSLYLIGRRESGFVRSFIYRKQAISIFLAAHLLCYSAISLLHFSAFYLITKAIYGSYELHEFLHLMASYYVSYLFFSCIGLIGSLLPLKFTTASTLFSIIAFTMLALGYMGAVQLNSGLNFLRDNNPLAFSTKIFLGEIPLTSSALFASALLFTSILITYRYYRIQPVWSRY